MPFRDAILFLLTILPTACSYGQIEGRIADRPIGVGYTRNISQVSAFEYMAALCKRLQIGETLVSSAPQEQLDALRSEVDVPINGASWYLVQGLLPSFETVYFQQVVDAADARRFVHARKSTMGNQGEVKAEGDDRYRYLMTNSWSHPVETEEEGQKQVDQINAVGQNSNRGFRNSARLIEKDGKPHIEQSFVMEEFYRYHDSLLFSTSFEELWEMDLPTRESLTSSISAENDIGVEAFFDRIPMAIKTLGWNMLNSTAGTQMQARDGEQQTEADLRKASIDTGLGIVKAAMFDVQEANGWVKFANESQQSVRAEFNLVSRRNSALTKQLDEVAAATSRFAPILNDDAAATLHFCFRISEDTAELPRAAANSMIAAVQDSPSASDIIMQSFTRLADTVAAFAESRNLEAILKAGWTEESGGVIYGGLQVGDNPLLLRSIHQLATNIPETPPAIKEAFSLTDTDGQETLKITLPPDVMSSLQDASSLKLSHIYLVHHNSALWFALGNENAIAVVRQSVARCTDGGLATRTPLMTATIDVERWLSYPQDDAVGVGGFLSWLDRNVAEFPPNPVSVSVRLGGTWGEKPTPLLQKCIDIGGDTNASFTVMADSGGVRISASLGKALANYYLARMIDTQDKFISPQEVEADEATLRETPTPGK